MVGVFRNYSALNSRHSFSFLLLIGTLVSCYNYQFVSMWQIDMLPMIYREVNPQYLTNDFFTNSSQLFNEDFVFASFIGFLATIIGIPLVVFLLTLSSNIGIAVAAYLSAKDLSKGSKAMGLWAAVLFLSIRTFQWGNRAELFRFDLTPEQLIMPFLILCVWQGLKQNIRKVGIYAALASIIHPLSGPGIGGIMLLQILIGKIYRKEFKKRDWKEFLIAGSFISVPALIHAFQYLTSFNYQMADRLFIEIMNVRFPHHYLPSTFLKDEKLIIGVVFLGLSFYAWKRLKKWEIVDNSTFQSLWITSLVLLFFCFLGWLFAEVFPNRFIITLQLWRFLTILKIIGIISLSLFFGHSILKVKNKSLGFSGKLLLVLIVVFLFYLSIDYKLLFLIAILLLSLLLNRKLFGMVSILLLFGILHNNLLSFSSETPSYFSYFKVNYRISDLHDAEADIAKFIKENTPNDSRLLCGPRNGRLRILANRALVIEGFGIPMNDKGMEEWWSRLNQVYNRNSNRPLNHIRETEVNYNRLQDDDFYELRKKYNFDYVLVKANHKSELKELYQNSYFKLLEIPKQ